MIIRKYIKLSEKEKLKIGDIRDILIEFSDEDELTIFRGQQSKKPGDPETIVYYFTMTKNENNRITKHY